VDRATSTIADRRREFRALHESGCFVLPNPWDVGSARLFASLGFRALATTSSGFAWTIGRADNEAGREAVLAHLRVMVEATGLPVNADFESGFGARPEDVEESVGLAVATGVAGLSIEDSTGVEARPLYELPEAVERVRAARRAIDAAGGDTLLVGRAECFFAGRPDLDETIRRLQAYAEAGADCLYAPGLRTAEQVGTVVRAVAPRPVNVLVAWAGAFTVSELADLGVRRVSVGGALARTGWAAVLRAARLLVEEGRFDGFADAGEVDLNGLLAAGRRSRERSPRSLP